MITIEERIAEYCIIPAPEKRFCEISGCGTALARANKESLCYRHAQIEAAKKRQLNWEKRYFAEYRKAPRLRATIVRPKKFCCVMDCTEEVVASRNRSGRCVAHNHILCGMQMKDGSIPRPHTTFSRRVAETVAKIKAAA
jgi:hypothetical protein